MQEKIRFLVITHNYPRFEGDFAGVFIHLLLRRVAELGLEPVVLAPHAEGAKEEEIMDGIKVYRFRYAARESDQNLAYRGNMHKLVLGSVSGIFRFKHFLDCFREAAVEIIKKEKIDLVAGHWLIPAGLVMKTIASKHKLPMILSSHGTDIRLMRRYFNAAYRYLKSFCNGLKRWTVVSNFLKDEIISMDSSLADTLEVLPMPHDESLFYNDDSISTDQNLIVAVTRFTDQKRVDYLIKAFALVCETNNDARLEIYGQGDLRPEIDKLIERFGLGDRVAIYRPVLQKELREVYNQAAIVVLNSYQEGFGLALSEAMLCGTAVIGSSSGGITDIIEHESRGLLVPIDDLPALAEAIKRLLNDTELRGKLARDGQKFASENYASMAMAKKYADIVRAAVG